MDNHNPYTAPAVCPLCGELQEVDQSRDAAICRRCGEPFSVQRGLDCYRDRFGALPSAGFDPFDDAQCFDPAPYTEPQKPRKRHTFWWVLGWIFIFPIPLTILMLRNRRLPPGARYAIIAVGWVVYLLLGVKTRTGNSRSQQSVSLPPAYVTTTPAPRQSTATPPAPESTPRPTATPRPTPKPTEEPWPTAEPEEVEQAQPTLEPAPPTEEPAPPTEPPAAVSDTVTPSFKAAMDSYEAFFDEYCEFMHKMADDSSNVMLLLEYAEFMAQYEETMEKLDAIDEDALSPADHAYYIEVMTRINVKLLEAAEYMD